MQYDYIIQMLNSQDNSLVISNIEFINNTYYIYLYSTKTENYCLKCG